MTSDRKQPSMAFWATVVVLCVLALPPGYFGAYLLVVNPTRVSRYYPMLGVRRAADPHYRAFGKQDFWKAFFEPANSLDRWIRPKIWAPEDSLTLPFQISGRDQSAGPRCKVISWL